MENVNIKPGTDSSRLSGTQLAAYPELELFQGVRKRSDCRRLENGSFGVVDQLYQCLDGLSLPGHHLFYLASLLHKVEFLHRSESHY